MTAIGENQPNSLAGPERRLLSDTAVRHNMAASAMMALSCHWTTAQRE
jgi:hypothetical protein